MKATDLLFVGNDPGAARYGNFINYYSFHSVKERIDNLDPKMFPPATNQAIFCLDVGCNTGELSIELYNYIKILHPNNDTKMLAVDIDPVLIHRAQESNTNPNITFVALNISIESSREEVHEYLVSHNRIQFDVAFCFSVTMWIHLNSGDDGLKEFLTYVKNISNTIIIEPQPWNCYRNAQRRVKKSGSSFPLYETLQIRSNIVEEIENAMTEKSHKKVYESTESSWKRKVQSYQRL